MKRARDIAIEVKRKGDKRRRYQLREAEDLVSFCQKFFWFGIIVKLLISFLFVYIAKNCSLRCSVKRCRR